MTLIALSLVGLLVSAALLYAKSKTGTATLLVTVREEELVQIQGESVILKIRLASGVTAKLWGDTACGAPGQEAMVLTKSGTYTISLGSVSQDQRGYVCLLSSDGTLRDSLPIKGR